MSEDTYFDHDFSSALDALLEAQWEERQYNDYLEG
jgi:hypothetical protein